MSAKAPVQTQTQTKAKQGNAQLESVAARRKQALDFALQQIAKQYGEGMVMRLGDKPVVEVACVPSGSLALDMALGGKGFPRGRVVEIYGPESSGKTTLALTVVGQVQKHGGVAAFIDVEHALDVTYARALGVDVDNMYLTQPDYGEQALEICDMLIRSGAVDIVVVDSVAALVPKAEIDGEMGDVHMGLQARLMSQALRKLTAGIHRSGTLCVFINQIREKIGVSWGSPETTPGGRALKFYSSVRCDIRRIGKVKGQGDTVIGNETRVKVVKNKIAPPFQTAEFEIIYGKGISHEAELLTLGIQFHLVKKSGSWLSYGETRLGQGRENAKTFLIENPDIAAQIEKGIQDNMTT